MKIELTLKRIEWSPEADWAMFLNNVRDRDLTDAELKEWNERKCAEGERIDPRTAEVMFLYTDVADPYYTARNDKERSGLIGRSFFARNLASTNWVYWDDLPAATQQALAAKRHEANVEGWRRVFAAQAGIDPDQYEKMTTEEIDKILAEKFPESEDYEGPAITDIDVVTKVSPQ